MSSIPTAKGISQRQRNHSSELQLTGDETFDKILQLDPEALAAQVSTERVVGQDEFVRKLCASVNLSLTRSLALIANADADDLPNAASTVVIGATGSGKTYAIRQVFKALGIEMDVINVANLTGAGWSGLSIDDVLAPIQQEQAEGKFEIKAILWDEFDKLGHHKTDQQSSFNPSKELLKLLDGGNYRIEANTDKGRQMGDLDTRFLVHVFSGAFTGIDEIVKARLDDAGSRIGFARPADDGIPLSADELYRQATPADLEAWGISRELCGRIGNCLYLTPLDKEAMHQILRESPNSLQRRYERLLGRRGVKLSIADDAADFIVNEAMEAGLGARGLDRAAKSVLAPAMAEAQSTGATLIRIVATPDGETGFELEGNRGDGTAALQWFAGEIKRAIDEAKRNRHGAISELELSEEDEAEFSQSQIVKSVIDRELGPRYNFNNIIQLPDVSALAKRLAALDSDLAEADPGQVSLVAQALTAAIKIGWCRWGDSNTFGSLYFTVFWMARDEGVGRCRSFLDNLRKNYIESGDEDVWSWFDEADNCMELIESQEGNVRKSVLNRALRILAKCAEGDEAYLARFRQICDDLDVSAPEPVYEPEEEMERDMASGGADPDGTDQRAKNEGAS